MIDLNTDDLLGPDLHVAIRLAAALAIGLLIGIERGWSGREEEEGSRIGGVRTFSLIGLLGGVWALLAAEFGFWILAVAFAVISTLIIVGHVVEARRSYDIGITTEFSMMLTFSLAAWAALGFTMHALGTAVVAVTLLGTKPILHRWLKNIETEEIYAGIKLLIISVVLLPLLPNNGYGPWQALNPYWIWWMVVLISGISFVGYFAIKYAGSRLGTLLTAITGGLASSTAVTFSLAHFARQYKTNSLFMGGIMVAASIMFVRVLVEVAIVNPALLHPLWIPILVMFLSVLIAGYWLWRKGEALKEEPRIELDNPFKLAMAIKFGALLAIILVLSAAMKEWFGDGGIYILSIVSGLMDVDAIALTLSRLALGDLSASVAVMGIVLASAVNTVVKGVIFAFIVGMKASVKLIALLSASVLLGLIAAMMI